MNKDLKLYKWFKQLKTIYEEMDESYNDIDNIVFRDTFIQLDIIIGNLNREIDTTIAVKNELTRYSDEITRIKQRLSKLEIILGQGEKT